jgi:hypothetical protein
VEKHLTKTQALLAIFQGESSPKWKIREAYVQDLLAQCHFKKLHKQQKVKKSL